jgi:hypothetical protein
MKIRAIAITGLSLAMLVGCSPNTSNSAGANSQPPTPAPYTMIDIFQDPSGNEVVLYCRHGHLFVSKDGSREGSLQFFYQHEMCKGF